MATEILAASHQRQADSARVLLLPLLAEGPGIAVAVARRGRPLWVEGLGWADLKTREPVDPDSTLFRIYSISKALTHVAAARLVEAGELDLGAPVQRYVDFAEKEGTITPLHLLQHTSGIRHYRDGAEAASARHCDTVSDAIAIFRDDPLVHPPGRGRTYSSWGYVLLSRVLEEAAGVPFDALIRREVLEPGGARGVRIDDPTAEVRRRASFYTVTPEGPGPARPVDNTCKWGAGAYLATAPDLVRLLEALRAGRLLAEPVFRRLVAPAAEESEWGSPLIRVQGWAEGGTAFAALDLESGTSVVLLSNGIGPDYGPAVQQAYGQILRLFASEERPGP